VKLFAALILRPLRHDILRTALSIFAVALGVGVVIAIYLAGDAAGGSFQSSLQTVVGRVDLEIMANGGLDETVIGKLTALPINARFCPVLEAATLFGIDPFLCVKDLSLSGKSTKGESYKIVDIAEAQQTLHRFHQLDRILIFVDARQNFEDAERQIKSALPPGYQIEKPGTRSEENRRMLRAFRWNLRVLSYISLVVGAFLIYNTISISVVRRRSEIGICARLARRAKRSSCSFSAKLFSLDWRAPRWALSSAALWRKRPLG
jgi:putative ABC transport system permease protein